MPLTPAKRGATYADVEAAPEGLRAELIGTDLYLQAKARGTHQRAAMRLASQLDDRATGWVILADVELRLPDTLAPDISGWRAERFTESLESARFTVAPDWVCEVLSPSTEAYDRIEKADVYRKAGVRHMWLVDTAEQLVEAYTANDGPWVRVGVWMPSKGARVRLEPFDLEVDAGRIFGLTP